ncbi:MAG: FtsQ-type POTRA domain-containing protein [Candidatus Desulfatibia sp.]|jgi:cell division protein FtsQ|uniref:cell division protein FtsQ/DivIB n=1 Tax=Candidatus Desulfatibia sp. TaxID=3101189 RepID=UPI002F2F7491
MEYFKASLKISAGIAALLLVSFIFIFGYDFLTQTDYFKTESFSVTGIDKLTKEQVLKQARLDKGVNILSVNLSEVRKRLTAHLWIAEAEVSRELPSKIHIRIKEQKALAVIDLERKFLINTAGEIFKEVSATDPDNLPVVSGLEFSDINVLEETRSLPFDAVMQVLKLGQNPNSLLPNTLIKRIHIDREIGLTIYAPAFASGMISTIKLGYHNYPGKYAGLKTVLAYIKKRNELSRLVSIDLNNLDRIVVLPVSNESPASDQKEV